MKLIDGRALAQNIYENLKEDLSSLNIIPKLSIILASQDAASLMYVKMKQKKAEEIGINVELIQFEDSVKKQDITKRIQELNEEISTHGILVQLPLYSHLEEYREEILNTINIKKDVDCLSNGALNRVFSSNFTILPATVDAILECIKSVPEYINLQNLKEKNILIVNDSNLIGKPLAAILSEYSSNVTIANKYTKDIPSLSKEADVLITATGQTALFDASDLKDGAVVIDVTSMKVGDAVIGDVIHSAELEKKISYITPVPGGVGPLTIACLLRNLVRLTRNGE